MMDFLLIVVSVVAVVLMAVLCHALESWEPTPPTPPGSGVSEAKSPRTPPAAASGGTSTTGGLKIVQGAFGLQVGETPVTADSLFLKKTPRGDLSTREAHDIVNGMLAGDRTLTRVEPPKPRVVPELTSKDLGHLAAEIRLLPDATVKRIYAEVEAMNQARKILKREDGRS